jgi:hypothetical protein
MSEIAVPDAEQLKGLAQDLTELLRLRSLPIGMKLFEDPAALEAIPACAGRSRAASSARASW